MKRNYRTVLRERRNSLQKDEILYNSGVIMATLTESELFHRCHSLFMYMNIQNEVHTRPLIDFCFKINKPVFVPVTYGNEMFFSSLSEFSILMDSNFGIPVPEVQIPTEPDNNSLFVIPGLGFDKYGNRLGYGAGFYDKYLCCRKYLHLVGVCFENQLVDELPSDETDIQMDSVLTEKRWIFREKGGLLEKKTI